jgi:hypothetical protein
LSGSQITITDGQALEQGEYSSTLTGSYGSLVNLGALYQNITASVRSQRFFDLDYNSNQTKPVNYGAVTYSISQSQVDNYAAYNNPNNPYAELQDYNYNLKRSILPRYSGSQTISSTYNTYTAGDQSYGKTAAIDKIKYQYGYLVNIFSSSFQLPYRANAQIKYIIDNSENVLDLTKANKNVFTTQNVYKSGETVDISLFDYDPTNPYIQKLTNNSTFSIYEGGYRYSPILYNIGGSGSLTFNLSQPSSSITTTSIPSYVTITAGNANYWTITGKLDVTPVSPSTPGRFSVTGSTVVSSPSTLAVIANVTINNITQGGSFSYGSFTIPAGSTAGSFKQSQTVSANIGAPYNIWLPTDTYTITVNSEQTYNPSGGTSTVTSNFTSITDNQPCLWVYDSKTILLSATQSANYGNITLNASASGMDTPVFPLELNQMDLIRLYNVSSSWSPSSEYRVDSVYQDVSASINYYWITLDRDLNPADVSGSVIPGRICKYIILKRLPDETNIILNYDLGTVITQDGTIFPQYIDPVVRDNSGNVVKALKQQNLI